MALANVPFYSAYQERQQQIQAEPTQQLQQVTAASGLLAALQKQRQEQAFRGDLEALAATHGGTENIPQENLAALATKYASPHDVLATQQKSLDRKATLDAAASAAAEARAGRASEAEAGRVFRESEAEKSRAAQKDALEARLADARTAGRERMDIQMQLATMRADAQRESATRAADAAHEKGIEGQITKTSARLKDVMPVYTAARQLNEVLSKFTPDNVPGLGYAKNTDIGKAFLSDEGKDVASSQKLLGNSILKAMSGSAVTPSEEVRQMAAMMSDGRFSAKDFYLAWPKLSEWVNDQVSLGTAGLTPQGKVAFEERTGIKTDRIVPRFSTEYKDGLVSLKDSQAPAAPAAAGPRNARGWALMIDAKGNRAYVSPDGKQFEEAR